NQSDHPIEEGTNLTPRCPRVLERLEHRIHDRLRVALQAGEVQIALAAEGRIQPVTAGAGAANQPVHPGPGIAVPPEQLHRTVEGFSWVERLGPWHARPNSRTRSLISQGPARPAASTRRRPRELSLRALAPPTN